MSLNFGRTQLSIPGPSVIPERVLNAMHQPSPNIYGGPLYDLVDSLWPDLREVAQTKHNAAIYIGNGHAAWEAALANIAAPGDKLLVLGSGRFAIFWGNVARSMGFDIDVLDFGNHDAVEPERVAEKLKADKSHSYRAVLTVQTDTASSVRNDIAALGKAIKETGHPALFCVDCIASLGCEEHRMDDWGVDVMVSACQKGLMTPAGLGFVWFNDRAAEARERAQPSYYWDWKPRVQPDVFYQLFGGTAPTHHLFGLREALTMLVHEEGLENAWARHRTLARAIWAAVDAWGSVDEAMRHNIQDASKRSFAVSAIRTQDGAAGKLRNWCEKEGGVTLGIGLGLAEKGTPEWDRQFRMGHMGHTNPAMILSLLGVIQAGLTANSIPHGSGAIEAAAKVIGQTDEARFDLKLVARGT